MNKIGIIGLGYVGLPLAVAFGEKYNTVGFDINENRVRELKDGRDNTLEIEENYLKQVLKEKNSKIDSCITGFFPTSKIVDISDCNIFIITVPTPTDKNNRPVLTPLVRASESVGHVLKKGDIVIYESTVYPGVTEDECVPILEKVSKLTFNKDFFVGYSPERINPGDKEHTVKKITKVTSGSTPESAKTIDGLYRSIIEAGTYLAPTIKVAEAAKVIENSQRDINIAFVNELAKIFSLLKIDTNEVLKAAQTKWNFLPFKPGLVGGHCIGVDPFYLAQKAQEVGYNPEIILSGRRINDSMGSYVADEFLKLLIQSDTKIKNAKILMMGFTFKENCPDIRNTGVINVYNRLLEFGIDVTIYDPWIDKEELIKEYNVEAEIEIPKTNFDGIIVCVAHNKFKTIKLENYLKAKNSPIYDLKGIVTNPTKRL